MYEPNSKRIPLIDTYPPTFPTDFVDVYRDGNADFKHEIIKYPAGPDGKDAWFIIYCQKHGVHFGDNPLISAIRHLDSWQHGRMKATKSQAVALLGVPVRNCNAELAEINNTAFKKALGNGYKPLNSNRLPAHGQIYIKKHFNSQFFDKNIDLQGMTPIERATYRFLHFEPPRLSRAERLRLPKRGKTRHKLPDFSNINVRSGQSKCPNLPSLQELGERDEVLSSSIAQLTRRWPHITARSRRQVSRTKTGCITCRERGKKCDERKPYCRHFEVQVLALIKAKVSRSTLPALWVRL
ncbi:hypothetical protein LZ30DRAFT_739277 [Colletotrichum cereale]|nr:hypothetical protein LZ30DRAFT_739277 [Colletotrichum cereale]